LIGRCTTDLPIWLDLDRAQVVGELRSAGRLRERPTRVRTGMGTLRDLLVSMEPIQADRAPCFLSVMIDVTERNQAEIALREQRDQHEVLLQGLSDLGEGVVVGECEQLVYVHDAFCSLVGYT